MAKQDIMLKGVEIPDGWEATGEYRHAREGESYQCGDKVYTLEKNAFFTCKVLILRRGEPDHVKLARLAIAGGPYDEACTLANRILAKWKEPQDATV